MDLFNFNARVDPKRKERLIRIQKSIESSIRFEEDAMSKPLNASTLKRVYNIDSLWIIGDGGTKKMGSADYSKELAVFKYLRDKYSNLRSAKLQVGSDKYHMLERQGRVYVFSTQSEMTNSDVFMILRDIEDSLAPKKFF